jgi:IS30 family transposase
MKQRPRRYISESEMALIWDRWEKGEFLNAIARDLGRYHSAVQGALASTGGIRPAK